MKIATKGSRGKFTKSRQDLAAHVQKSQAGVEVDSYREIVEKKAYELYENRGRADGCAWEDWFQAEKLVREVRQPESTF